MKIPARFQLKNLEKTNRVLNENVKKNNSLYTFGVT